MKKRFLSLALVLSLVLALVPIAPDAVAAEAAKGHFTPITGWDMMKELGVGINLGCGLEGASTGRGDFNEQYMAHDSVDIETLWNAPMNPDLFRAIALKGFDSVRIQVTWENHMTDGVIDEEWLNRVEEVINYGVDVGLYVIITTYSELRILSFLGRGYYEQAEKELSEIWSQIASRFKDYSEKVLFDIINEPSSWDLGTGGYWGEVPLYENSFSNEYIELINKLNVDVLNTIRGSGGFNDKRCVLLETPMNEYSCTDRFIAPDDTYTLLTIHWYYYPIDDLSENGLEENIRHNTQMFSDKYLAGVLKKGIPVHFGEFNIDPHSGTPEQRAELMRLFATSAAELGIPVTWWCIGLREGPYTLMDRFKLEWLHPDLLEILFTAYGKTPGPDYIAPYPADLPYSMTGVFRQGTHDNGWYSVHPNFNSANKHVFSKANKLTILFDVDVAETWGMDNPMFACNAGNDDWNGYSLKSEPFEVKGNKIILDMTKLPPFNNIQMHMSDIGEDWFAHFNGIEMDYDFKGEVSTASEPPIKSAWVNDLVPEHLMSNFQSPITAEELAEMYSLLANRLKITSNEAAVLVPHNDKMTRESAVIAIWQAFDAAAKYSRRAFDINLHTAHDWARTAISEANNKGFVPADLLNNYTATITRAEFCRLAVKWLEYKTGKNIDTILKEKFLTRNQNAFSDTQDSDILAAYALGITSGTGNGQFTPNGQFTREQAATMVLNTCKAAGMDVSDIASAGFEDIGAASSWAVDSINFCNNNGIMNGTSISPKLFSPKLAYTREQSIITFDNIW